MRTNWRASSRGGRRGLGPKVMLHIFRPWGSLQHVSRLVDNSCYNTLSSAFSNCERKLVRRRGAGRGGRLGPRPRGRISELARRAEVRRFRRPRLALGAARVVGELAVVAVVGDHLLVPVPVRTSTGESFLARTRPCWLNRAVKDHTTTPSSWCRVDGVGVRHRAGVASMAWRSTQRTRRKILISTRTVTRRGTRRARP